MVKKISLIVFYMAVTYALFVYGDRILLWMQESNRPWAVAGIATLMALFPIIPYPVVGAAIGAAYGPVLGGWITWVGSSAASILFFLFVRYGFQDWGQHVLQRYKGVARITRLFERNAFLTIVFARTLPFIPSIIINTYAALSRVSFLVYALASSLGKIPPMILFAVVGDSLMTEPRGIILAVGVYGVFLGLMLGLHKLWSKRAV